MKAQEFQALFEMLDGLSAVQRSALASKSSSNEAIALIEARFAAAPACGHCQSERFGTWGHANALRRYKCRDCGRTFVVPKARFQRDALTGTPLAQLHHTYPLVSGGALKS